MAIARVRTIFSGRAGAPWLGTAYFDGLNVAAAQDWPNAVGAFWGAADAFMNDLVTWTTEAEVVILAETTGAPIQTVNTTPVTGQGAIAGEIAPTLIQGLMRWRTADFENSRRVQGRWFIPGLAESQLGDGVLVAGTVTALNTAAAAYIAGIETEPVIWRRPVPADPTAVPPIAARPGSMHVITSGSATNRFSPLRSRRD